MMHLAKDRLVLTWMDHANKPIGIITGKHHVEEKGFEVDHIVRFPDTDPGAGTQMCYILLPRVVHELGLKWILLKIHDHYRPGQLRDMAKSFAFHLQSREKDMEYWRRDF